MRILVPSDAKASRAIDYVAKAPVRTEANIPAMAQGSSPSGSHTVRRGESAWTIARRYGMQPQQLLTRNGLASSAVLKPGMVLKLEADAGGR